MRSLLLTALPLLLLACAADGPGGEPAPPRTPVAAAEVELDDSAEPEAPAPSLTVLSVTSNRSQLLVRGSLDGAPGAPVLRLRTDLGCAYDATLDATVTGASFSVPLDPGQLTALFACAISVEAADAAVGPITVTPDAETVSADADLRLDGGLIAVVAADLDARSGHMVRFEVIAEGPLDEARATLDGVTYAAVVTPSDDTDQPRTALFEVPARAWADAFIKGSTASIDVTRGDGTHGALVLLPTARVEALDDVEDCH